MLQDEVDEKAPASIDHVDNELAGNYSSQVLKDVDDKGS